MAPTTRKTAAKTPVAKKPRASKGTPARAAAILAARALEGMRAVDVAVVDVTGVSPITDFLVLGTGDNPRHVRALAEEVERALKSKQIRPMAREGMQDPRWALLDYGPIVVHLFQPDTRSFYDLDMLWGDGKKVRWAQTKKTTGA
jgi:ribosome-associated protein